MSALSLLLWLCGVQHVFIQWKDNYSFNKLICYYWFAKLFAERWKCSIDKQEFLSTKLYSFGMMVNGSKSTDVAERHTIFCVDHDSDLRNCLIFCQKQPKKTSHKSFTVFIWNDSIPFICCCFFVLFLFCFVDKYSVLRGLKRARERNAICHFYHLTFPGIWLLGNRKEPKQSLYSDCFVCCLFLLISHLP